MRTVPRALVPLLLALALVAPPATRGAEPPGTWYGDVASARAFLADLAKLYELRHRGRIALKAVNTVAALELLHQGRTELVGSVRGPDPRNPAETALAFVPVAWDSLVLIVHPGNPAKSLSLKQLRDVLAGRITDWRELGGAPRAINLYAVAGPLDGVEFALRRIVFGNGAAAVAARRWYITTQQLEEAIAIDPAGLGVSLGSNVHGHKGLRALAIEGVLPTPETLERGEYLLATPLYLVARGDVPGQDASLSPARRALAFLNAEPAMQTAMRRKQLVPMASARALEASREARERFIATTLALKAPAAPLLAGPPAPPKTAAANVTRVADVARTARPPVAAVDRGEANAPRTRDAAQRAACRPAAVCD